MEIEGENYASAFSTGAGGVGGLVVEVVGVGSGPGAIRVCERAQWAQGSCCGCS